MRSKITTSKLAHEQLTAINPNATSADHALIDKRQMIFDRVYLEPREIALALAEHYPTQIKNFNLPAIEITAADLRNLAGLEKVMHQTPEANPAAVRFGRD